MRVLGVICARAGSKGIINKNIQLLDNKPLIWYSIVAVNHAKLLTRTIVSTDSIPILSVAKRFGAEVPFLRPPELADDKSRIDDAVLHALNYCEAEEGKQYDAVVLLQNSTLRLGIDIDKCIELLNDGDAVMSISPAESYQIYSIAGNKLIPQFILPDIYRRQDVSLYTPNGAVYAMKRDLFLATKRIMNDKCLAYVMPSERSFDIHTEQDFIKAEAIMRSQYGVSYVKGSIDQSYNPGVCGA